MTKNLLIGGAILIAIIGAIVVTENKDQNDALENATTPPLLTAETTLETASTAAELSGTPGEVTPSTPTPTNPAVTVPAQKTQSVAMTPTPVVVPAVPALPSKAPYVATIYYDGTNFIPEIVTIPEGSTVLFENASERELWVATNPHESHSRYPVKSAGDCLGSSFDQCDSMKKGETWSFTFTEVGEWKYHNHMRSFDGGEIIVLTKEKYLEAQKKISN